MAEIISFYSVAPSQGKRTLSVAYAELLATQGYKTLYMELDVFHPSLAITNQITNPIRNVVEYFQKTLTNKDFNVENYVINKDILTMTDNRELKKIFSEMPNKLDYLVIPSNYNVSNFPVIIDSTEKEAEKKAHEYIQKFMYSLKNSKYDYIVLNLPNEINSIFGFEVITESDYVLNILTASANRLYENREVITFLSSNVTDFDERLYTIVNQTSPLIDVQTLKDLVRSNNKFLTIPFDLERQQKELALENGSPVISESIERLAQMMKIEIDPTPSKKSGLGLFRRN